jgi:hypothetical protein
MAMAVGLPLIAQDDTTGTDIDTAIPIWFGEDAFDTLDSVLRHRLVYRIDLARGQGSLRFAIGMYACFRPPRVPWRTLRCNETAGVLHSSPTDSVTPP